MYVASVDAGIARLLAVHLIWCMQQHPYFPCYILSQDPVGRGGVDVCLDTRRRIGEPHPILLPLCIKVPSLWKSKRLRFLFETPTHFTLSSSCISVLVSNPALRMYSLFLKGCNSAVCLCGISPICSVLLRSCDSFFPVHNRCARKQKLQSNTALLFITCSSFLRLCLYWPLVRHYLGLRQILPLPRMPLSNGPQWEIHMPPGLELELCHKLQTRTSASDVTMPIQN